MLEINRKRIEKYVKLGDNISIASMLLTCQKQ